MRIINKFGGEIIGNPCLAKLAVKRLKEQLGKNQKPVVVVSALAGVTDKLVKLGLLTFSTGVVKVSKVLEGLMRQHRDWAARLMVNNQKLERALQNLKRELENNLRELKGVKPPHQKFGGGGENELTLQDRILSYGEKFSSLLFTELLQKQGIPAVRLTGEELGIITDENFGDANIKQKESLKNIRAKLKNISQMPVIAGFIGKTRRGKTTTLGRGGSDTTACLVGAALNPSKVILWKNVPGVLSADPKIVKNPKMVKFLSYGEAEEAGKVIHTKAIDLVRGKGIKVEVTYIAAPEQKTIVENNVIRKDGAKIISSKDNLYLLIVRGEKMVRPGALFEITKVISQEGINIVLIRDTKSKVYLVVERNSHDFEHCKRKVRELGYQLSIKEVSMVNAVGRMDWKIAERFNQLLYKFCPGAELGAFPYRSCLMLEAIVGKSKVKKLIKIFHKEFINNSKI